MPAAVSSTVRGRSLSTVCRLKPIVGEIYIYTSYYSRLRAIDQEKMIPVAVSRGVPAWYSGHVMQELAPPWDLVKKMKSCTTRQMSAAEYLCQTLYPLCPKQIRSRLQGLSCEKDVVLLCWRVRKNIVIAI